MTTQVCGNGECSSINTELSVAPLYIEIYFGLHKKRDKSLTFLCKECMALGQAYRKKCVEALYNNECMLNVPRRSVGSGPEIINLDSDHGSCSINLNNLFESLPDKVLITLSDQEIADLVNDVLAKVNIGSQLTLCEETFTARIAETASYNSTLEQQCNTLEKQVNDAWNLYSSTIDKLSSNSPKLKLKSIIIDSLGNETFEADEESNSTKNRTGNGPAVTAATAPLRNSNSNNTRLSSQADESTNILDISEHGNSPMSTEDDLEKKNQKDVADVLGASFGNKKSLFLYETPKTIPRVLLKVGDTVFAMKINSLGAWSLGEIHEIIKHPNNKPTYRIKFETKKRGRTDAVINTFKELTAKQLAYNVPCPFILPVGTRIIGLFHDDFAADEGVEQQDPLYYAGIVAEPPKVANSFRYLIFFDDGYSQYLQQNHVLLVCDVSDHVWLDVHADSQDFIRKYIQKYPERPMVRLEKGKVLSTEWKGQWWTSRVISVDCSLAKMYFQADNRYEWIYRGSTRLAPLFDSEKRLAERANNKNTTEVNRSLPRQNNKTGQKLMIEYLYGNEDEFQNKNKAMARKSSTTIPGKNKTTTQPAVVPVAKQNRPSQKRPIVNLTEFEGNIQSVRLKNLLAEPREYVVHVCDESCVTPFDFKALPREKPINPLSMIFYYGWTREIVKGQKRQIVYRAPCGRRIRDMYELHDFLLTTEFNLSVDYFSFDVNVECNTEFVPSKALWSIKDISYGKEIVPIQCINSLDHDYPEYVEYTRHSVKGNGVPLELDQNFLVCCDCTDDCQDKEKCACWQLTYECYRKTRKVTDKDLIGYTNRTLKQHQVSGIYECNPRCQCRKTCHNRVAQNPTKWLLQVFKTSNRGWAIRSLNDIPEGSFICIYAGQILTEHIADQDGKNYGDEYLAELNFIEVCEENKEGYEAECVQYDDMEVDDDDLNDNDENFKMSKRSRVLNGVLNGNGKPNGNEGDSGYFDMERDQQGLNRLRPRTSQLSIKSSNGPSSFSMPLSNNNKAENQEKTTRDYFNNGEPCFIVDAKSIGSIGRYLNHSCSPNVYVQNVFVDTHDLRFPWVAFFTSKVIKAGTELMWDYNYEVGSVPGRIFYCQCGSSDCRGRLL